MMISALLPVCILVVLGFAIARTPLSSPSAWELVERLTYYLFFPALLIDRLRGARYQSDDLLAIAVVVIAAIAVITLLLLAARRLLGAERGGFGVLFQGSIRFNTYIGLAVLEALYGESGLTRAALCLAVYIPLVNLLSVVALTGGGDGQRRTVVVAGSVVTNPLVLACAVGLGMSYADYALPPLAAELLALFSQPALPLGLLAVGAGIRFVALGSQAVSLATALIAKLLLFPGLVLLACLLFETETALAITIVLLTSLPAPPSAYILARQLGADAGLMANIITVQTIAAFFLLPLWIELGNRYL